MSDPACRQCVHRPITVATDALAISRTAGWIAHAAEEYTEPYLRFRGRAVKVPKAFRGKTILLVERAAKRAGLRMPLDQAASESL